MSVHVKVNRYIFSVPKEYAEKAAYDLIKGAKPKDVIEELTKQKVCTPITMGNSLGFFNFDELAENGGPTIFGKFYRDNTSYGRKFYRKADPKDIRIF